MQTKDLTAVALLAALAAVCSQFLLPTPWGVPVSLGTLAVFLAAGLLGAKGAMVSMLIYLALGAVGVPVFAGFRGGLSVLAGPTGGYLVGYLALAALSGALCGRLPDTKFRLPLAFACGLAVCYTLGTLWFAVSTETTVLSALTLCVLPYLPADAVKIVVAAVLCERLRVVQRSK
ncbi:MAG: biotin transporter BioY [Butyricicoccus sp.]|nr:biotin transporter BioY [Butyricicoccus sp.]